MPTSIRVHSGNLNLALPAGVPDALSSILMLGASEAPRRPLGTYRTASKGGRSISMKKVGDGYRKLEEMYPGRIVGIVGGRSIEGS
jgi:hypothetical protein